MVTSVEAYTAASSCPTIFGSVKTHLALAVPAMSAGRLNNTSVKRRAVWAQRSTVTRFSDRMSCIPALENEGVSLGCRGGLSHPAAAI